MTQLTAILAILTSSIYTGAAWYLLLVEESVRRTPRYAPLALLAAVGLLRGGLSLASCWTWGSLSMFSVLPFTVVAILPLQRRILAMDHGSAAVMVRSMLPRWGRLQAVRVGLGLTGSFPFLWAAL